MKYILYFCCMLIISLTYTQGESENTLETSSTILTAPYDALAEFLYNENHLNHCWKFIPKGRYRSIKIKKKCRNYPKNSISTTLFYTHNNISEMSEACINENDDESLLFKVIRYFNETRKTCTCKKNVPAYNLFQARCLRALQNLDASSLNKTKCESKGGEYHEEKITETFWQCSNISLPCVKNKNDYINEVYHHNFTRCKKQMDLLYEEFMKNSNLDLKDRSQFNKNNHIRKETKRPPMYNQGNEKFHKCWKKIKNDLLKKWNNAFFDCVANDFDVLGDRLSNDSYKSFEHPMVKQFADQCTEYHGDSSLLYETILYRTVSPGAKCLCNDHQAYDSGGQILVEEEGACPRSKLTKSNETCTYFKMVNIPSCKKNVKLHDIFHLNKTECFKHGGIYQKKDDGTLTWVCTDWQNPCLPENLYIKEMYYSNESECKKNNEEMFGHFFKNLHNNQKGYN